MPVPSHRYRLSREPLLTNTDFVLPLRSRQESMASPLASGAKAERKLCAGVCAMPKTIDLTSDDGGCGAGSRRQAPDGEAGPDVIVIGDDILAHTGESKRKRQESLWDRISSMQDASAPTDRAPTRARGSGSGSGQKGGSVLAHVPLPAIADVILKNAEEHFGKKGKLVRSHAAAAAAPV